MRVDGKPSEPTWEPKGDVFLSRYIRLAHAIHDGPSEATAGPTTMTIGEIARLWDCSERAAQDSIQRLEAWGLLTWSPQPGRGKRSRLALLVHPVHVYFDRAERALEQGSLAEAGFWLSEVMRECPCIPAAATRLSEIRQQLGLAEVARCCEDRPIQVLP